LRCDDDLPGSHGGIAARFGVEAAERITGAAREALDR
jgi:hypothetical protein